MIIIGYETAPSMASITKTDLVKAIVNLNDKLTAVTKRVEELESKLKDIDADVNELDKDVRPVEEDVKNG